jgi:hypothetical protein
MKTVFRARIKPDGPRVDPWVPGMSALVSEPTLHAELDWVEARIYWVTVPGVQGWYVHESDLELFESWVEWPKGAQLVASTYTAERLLPGID